MEIQRSSALQPYLAPAAQTQAARAKEEQAQKRPRDAEDARQRDNASVDYRRYTETLVKRATDGRELDNYTKRSYSGQARQALSAYTAQQRSLDLEQMDNLRNLLGVDYYV